jgi:hypothetical protein
MRIGLFDFYQENLKIDIKRNLRGQQKLMRWLEKLRFADGISHPLLVTIFVC